MQIQNKYKHLHYLVCLGSGLRKASADITHDALPEPMRDRLKRLARAGDGTGASSAPDNEPPRQG